MTDRWSPLGVNLGILGRATRPFMSAMPPIATTAVSHSETSRCAITGREQMQQTNVRQCGYSITSSASASNLSGIARPSIFAVLRLITNSNLVDCSTGRSAGFTPLRIFPV